MQFTKLQTIADAIANHDASATINAIESALVGETGQQWHKFLGWLVTVVQTNTPKSTIIAKGNSKLPFLAFSSLPGANFCPGAGDCLNWCYSFRAWRYPAAFVRQAQNAWLLQSEAGRAAILEDLDAKAAKIAKQTGGKVDFRLYVDGDFSNVETVNYWFDALESRPNLATYGYSKSWSELLKARPAPANYVLNMSSGSKHTSVTEQRIRLNAMVRGDFVGVKMPYAVKSSDHGNREHQKRLRDEHFKQTGRKAFTCPGKCGDCTKVKHACGSRKFQGVDIVIAVH